jgi:hypothetical protein
MPEAQECRLTKSVRIPVTFFVTSRGESLGLYGNV